MKAAEALALSDSMLVRMYRQWSEDNYAAGWMMNHEDEFIDYLLAIEDTGWSTHYERATISLIRSILHDLAYTAFQDEEAKL